MEQRFNTITRNYSRKEGPEMFSLTLSRQIEVESTFERVRTENLIALFDVEMQTLMEMMNIEFVTKVFYEGRMKVFVKMFKGFVKLLESEMESGKLTRHQVYLNDATVDEVYARVGKYFDGDRREVSMKFSDVEDVVSVVESVEAVEVVKVEEAPKKTVVIEIPVEREVAEVVEEAVEEASVEVVEEVAPIVKSESKIDPEIKREADAAEGTLESLIGDASDVDLDDFLN